MDGEWKSNYLVIIWEIYNVNPGLINPKRLFNWEGTIYVPYCDYLEGTPELINHGLLIRGWH